jgi:hypothetical protein
MGTRTATKFGILCDSLFQTPSFLELFSSKCVPMVDLSFKFISNFSVDCRRQILQENPDYLQVQDEVVDGGEGEGFVQTLYQCSLCHQAKFL